jgi:hypothetical protein
MTLHQVVRPIGLLALHSLASEGVVVIRCIVTLAPPPICFFDTLATAGNARNYYTQSAGFTLRFLFNPIPTSTGLHVNSIPDWTGKQPFAIR